MFPDFNFTDSEFLFTSKGLLLLRLFLLSSDHRNFSLYISLCSVYYGLPMYAKSVAELGTTPGVSNPGPEGPLSCMFYLFPLIQWLNYRYCFMFCIQFSLFI